MAERPAVAESKLLALTASESRARALGRWVVTLPPRCGRAAGVAALADQAAVAMSQTSATVAASMRNPAIMQMASTTGESDRCDRDGRLKVAG